MFYRWLLVLIPSQNVIQVRLDRWKRWRWGGGKCQTVKNSRLEGWETWCHHTLTAKWIIIDAHLPHFPSTEIPYHTIIMHAAVIRNVLTSSWVRGPRNPSTRGSSACWRLRTHGLCYRPPDPAWRDPWLGCRGAPVTGICWDVDGRLKWGVGWGGCMNGDNVCGCKAELASQLSCREKQPESEKWRQEWWENQGCPPGKAAVTARRAALLGGVNRSSRDGRGWWILEWLAAEVTHRDREASGHWGREEPDPWKATEGAGKEVGGLKITGLNSEANVALCGPQIRGETGGLPALVREWGVPTVGRCSLSTESRCDGSTAGIDLGERRGWSSGEIDDVS